MMYIHYCKNCSRFHILNGHKQVCPACDDKLAEMQISYLEFVDLSNHERALLLELCQNEEMLKELSTTYHMYKYNKWYHNNSSMPLSVAN